MARNRAHGTFAIVLALFVASVIVEYVRPEWRHVKYLLPVPAFALAALTPAPRAPWLDAARDYFTTLLWVTAGAIAVSLLAALFEQTASARLFEETYFIMTPLVVARVMFPYLDRERLERYIGYIFAGVIAAYVLDSGPAALAMIRDPSAMALALLTSNSEAESGLSFLFGMFCLYFLFTDRKRWSLLAFVLVVLSIKRIAIFGTLACGIGYLALRAARFDVRRHRRGLAIAAVVANAAIIMLTYLLSRGFFDSAIQDYTGLPTEWATMGRAEIYDVLFSKLPITAFGHGLGSATVVLESSGLAVLNAHSDLLKYALEVGPIVSSVWLYTFYKASSRSLETVMLAVYLNVLLMTDNVSIYVTVMLAFYVLTGALLVERAAAAPPYRQHDPHAGERESCGEPEPGELTPLGA